jgi:hypothetical protein
MNFGNLKGSSNMRTKNAVRRFLAMALAAGLITAFAAPSIAAAQEVSPTGDQYGETATEIQRGAQPPAPDPEPSRVGSLPFTGADLVAMVAVALAVAGVGLALQRAVSREPGEGTG